MGDAAAVAVVAGVVAAGAVAVDNAVVAVGGGVVGMGEGPGSLVAGSAAINSATDSDCTSSLLAEISSRPDSVGRKTAQAIPSTVSVTWLGAKPKPRSV